jgi:hypothetical protein
MSSSYTVKYLRISSYIRKPFLICDFAPDPIWISLHMRKILFYFLSVQSTVLKITSFLTVYAFTVLEYSIIYSSRILCLSSCLSSCHPVILSSCHSCGTLSYLSYIYLGSSVCHIPVVLSSCHPVILASCHNCGTLCYSFSFNNQTDQGDEREGFEREGYRWRDRRWRDWRGRVWIDFSL